MNCKQGDMAVVVDGMLGTNIGKFVTCVRLSTHRNKWGAVWEVDRGDMWWRDNTGRRWQCNLAEDAMLMPINPLDDETTEQPQAVSVE